MTVKEFVLNHKNERFWLCPHIAKNISITPNPLECANEYTSVSSIPKIIMESTITKQWKEEEMWCLIWDNRNGVMLND